MEKHCIVIGGGHAGSQLAIQLRQGGWTGVITMINEEHSIPYHRPPLSKAYLSGEKSLEDIWIKPQNTYQQKSVDMQLATKVNRIDRENRQVELEEGQRLHYDQLAITTGAKVRKMSIEGADLAGVCYLRNIQDVDHIRTFCAPNKKAVIVGGGYIGLETASVLLKMGMEVTILEVASRILQRVTTEDISAFYHRVHSEEGVCIVTGVSVECFVGDTQVTAVRCADGSEYPVDLAIVGIGVTPDVALAEQAGLAIDNGIVVDEFARTSDDHIVAAGDCTFHYNPIYERHLRLESVQNANDQARVAANTLNGNLQPYSALPWFWSDQYDLKLQIAGLSQGFDRVIIRGDIANSRSFAAFYLKDNQLIAVDAVNFPAAFMLTKKALTNGQRIGIEKLADESVDIKDVFAPV